jgi:hypothetical protein
MQTELVHLKEDKSIVVYSHDDVEAILDHNKLLRGMEQKSDWGRHVASIPNVIMVKWLNEEWQRGSNIRYLSKEFDELVARKLKDPEWAYLRVDKPSSRVGYAR